jgi:hypothetical protein
MEVDSSGRSRVRMMQSDGERVDAVVQEGAADGSVKRKRGWKQAAAGGKGKGGEVGRRRQGARQGGDEERAGGVWEEP